MPFLHITAIFYVSEVLVTRTFSVHSIEQGSADFFYKRQAVHTLNSAGHDEVSAL